MKNWSVTIEENGISIDLTEVNTPPVIKSPVHHDAHTAPFTFPPGRPRPSQGFQGRDPHGFPARDPHGFPGRDPQGFPGQLPQRLAQGESHSGRAQVKSVKATSSAPLTDTTAQHKQHIFDMNCKICTDPEMRKQFENSEQMSTASKLREWRRESLGYLAENAADETGLSEEVEDGEYVQDGDAFAGTNASFEAANSSALSFGAANSSGLSFGAVNSSAPSFAPNSNAPSFGAMNSSAPSFGATNSSAPSFAPNSNAPSFGAANSSAPSLAPNSNSLANLSQESTPAQTQSMSNDALRVRSGTGADTSTNAPAPVPAPAQPVITPNQETAGTKKLQVGTIWQGRVHPVTHGTPFNAIAFLVSGILISEVSTLIPPLRIPFPHKAGLCFYYIFIISQVNLSCLEIAGKLKTYTFPF